MLFRSKNTTIPTKYSQVVDLNDSALKPEGWDGLTMPHAKESCSISSIIPITLTPITPLPGRKSGSKLAWREGIRTHTHHILWRVNRQDEAKTDTEGEQNGHADRVNAEFWRQTA